MRKTLTHTGCLVLAEGVQFDLDVTLIAANGIVGSLAMADKQKQHNAPIDADTLYCTAFYPQKNRDIA